MRGSTVYMMAAAFEKRRAGRMFAANSLICARRMLLPLRPKRWSTSGNYIGSRAKSVVGRLMNGSRYATSVHVLYLIRGLGEKLMRNINREDMQQLLDEIAKSCGRSVVDHLRFRLRSIFELALSEGAVDRNPATTLFTPRQFKAGRVRKVLTPDQSQAMLRVFNLRERVIARLATWEGMRPRRDTGSPTRRRRW
jgi:hypothetical protein